MAAFLSVDVEGAIVRAELIAQIFTTCVLFFHIEQKIGMRGNCFTVIFLALSLCPAVTSAAIQSDVDCDVKLYINDALVMFHSDATEPHVLQGRNSYCYKCAWSDIAEPGTCRYFFVLRYS